jgi:hypothetical protein
MSYSSFSQILINSKFFNGAINIKITRFHSMQNELTGIEF